MLTRSECAKYYLAMQVSWQAYVYNIDLRILDDRSPICVPCHRIRQRPTLQIHVAARGTIRRRARARKNGLPLHSSDALHRSQMRATHEPVAKKSQVHQLIPLAQLVESNQTSVVRVASETLFRSDLRSMFFSGSVL